MHNKIHSVIFLLFRIKNADTETGWNVRILRPVWIISAEIRYLLSEQKKFQNKSKNIDKVYQSVFFRCIMLLSYRVAFLCNVFSKFIIHQKALCDIFLWKSCKVVFKKRSWKKSWPRRMTHCCRTFWNRKTKYTWSRKSQTWKRSSTMTFTIWRKMTATRWFTAETGRRNGCARQSVKFMRNWPQKNSSDSVKASLSTCAMWCPCRIIEFCFAMARPLLSAQASSPRSGSRLRRIGGGGDDGKRNSGAEYHWFFSWNGTWYLDFFAGISKTKGGGVGMEIDFRLGAAAWAVVVYYIFKFFQAIECSG